jgi:hypothetical protein
MTSSTVTPNAASLEVLAAQRENFAHRLRNLGVTEKDLPHTLPEDDERYQLALVLDDIDRAIEAGA